MISRSQIDKLLNFKSDDHMMISFYLGLGHYGTRHKVSAIGAKDIIKQAISDANPNQALRQELEADAKRILDYLSTDFAGNAKGIAIFACAPAGIWQVFRLPVAVPNRCFISHVAHVLPMLKIVDESRRYCVTLVDKQKARIFTVYLGEMTERSDILDVVPGWHKQGGWAQARFQRHIDDHIYRHLKHVADTLFEFHKREGFGHLLIGGHLEIRQRFYNMLHSYLQRIFRGFIQVDVSSSTAEIARASIGLIDEIEAARSKELVEAVLHPTPGRPSCYGLESTLNALYEGRVHTLLLFENNKIGGLVCKACEMALLPSAKDCPNCKRAASQSDDISEHLVRMALEQDSEVFYVRPGTGLESGGGVGAILRW